MYCRWLATGPGAGGSSSIGWVPHSSLRWHLAVVLNDDRLSRCACLRLVNVLQRHRTNATELMFSLTNHCYSDLGMRKRSRPFTNALMASMMMWFRRGYDQMLTATGFFLNLFTEASMLGIVSVRSFPFILFTACSLTRTHLDVCFFLHIKKIIIWK